MSNTSTSLPILITKGKRESVRVLVSNIVVTRLLFHGSRISNWVGILSRGVLLPHIVTNKYGVNRTDAGMLGAGIYFGDASSTAVQYTTSGGEGTRMMLVCKVALGKMAPITKIDTSLVKAPQGKLVLFRSEGA